MFKENGNLAHRSKIRKCAIKLGLETRNIKHIRKATEMDTGEKLVY